MLQHYLNDKTKIYKSKNKLYLLNSSNFLLKIILLKKNNLQIKKNYINYKNKNKKNDNLTTQILSISTNIIKDLKLVGKAFKINLDTKNNYIEFKLGLSHFPKIIVPKQINIIFLKNNKIRIKSYKKSLINKYMFKIKSLKKINPYNGTGFFFLSEKIKLKKWTKKQ